MTRTRPVRTLVRALVLGVAVVTASLANATSAAVAASDERLPDLRMDVPQSFAVCGAPTTGTFQTENCPSPSANDRWLRFDSLIMNVGEGTFRVEASRASTAEDHMHTVQWIRQGPGSWRKVPTDAVLAWAQQEDGHPHWHTQGMERYQLFKLPEPFPGGAKVGVKHGYCFFDGFNVRPDLVHARSLPVYSFYSCGVPGQSQDALSLRVGLSVGWGDEYPWNYAGQRIDISGVDDGEYLLCITADPSNDFVELREGNNSAWARIQLTTSTQPYRVNVTVKATGRTACHLQLPYPMTRLSRSR